MFRFCSNIAVVAGCFRQLGRYTRSEVPGKSAGGRAWLAGAPITHLHFSFPPSTANHALCTSFIRMGQKQECVSSCKRIPSLCGPHAVPQGDSSACAPESYRVKRPGTAIKFLSHFRKDLFFFSSSTAFVSLFGCAFACSGQQKF